MYINRVIIKNFRLLKNSILDLRDEMSLLVGRNNTGKTSLIVLFEKFYKPESFHFNDFSIALRNQIYEINDKTDVDDLAIRLVLEIIYDEEDNLENLSEFILDLDPEIRTVKILFECRIEKESLLKVVSEKEGEDRKALITKLIDRHLKTKVFIFDDGNSDNLDSFLKKERHKLVEKELKDVKNLINLKIIHARRNVTSSEDGGSTKTLSEITTKYFNKENELSNESIKEINSIILNMDKQLGDKYELFFKDFLENSKNFLNLVNLKVISNIQSKTLLGNSSQVIYGSEDGHLPEHLNGLGYMNILYLLLSIEIKKTEFKKEKKSINILFIEEPEAHTHPQMQYIFANEIKKILKKIDGLQTIITSHSSCIVSRSDFEDIRYLRLCVDNVEIKNFHTDLQKRYKTEPDHFKFLKQYLNIQSAELFFASKVIFIEGITEHMLLPYFAKKFDDENIGKDDYVPLASQNITVLEVGANAKVFAEFLEFLKIKTLVITDIDSINKGDKTARPVLSSNCTSNATIRHFYDSPGDINSNDFDAWFEKLLNHSLRCRHENINVTYQKLELNNYSRSFEEAFITCNMKTLKAKRDSINGLKNREKLDVEQNIFNLTKEVIDKKSDFAASILYLALAKGEVEWEMPAYIKDGLAWIQSDDISR